VTDVEKLADGMKVTVGKPAESRTED
jgi:hypothetical protein